jgi:hypothetical protein
MRACTRVAYVGVIGCVRLCFVRLDEGSLQVSCIIESEGETAQVPTLFENCSCFRFAQRMQAEYQVQCLHVYQLLFRPGICQILNWCARVRVRGVCIFM